MMKSIKKLILGAVVPMAMAIMLPMTAMAAYPTNVRIPVTVTTVMDKTVETLETEADIPEQGYLVSITAEDGTPLPVQKVIPVTKSGKIEFGPITYTVPNDYVYTIKQTAKDGVKDRITLSKITEYKVTVRVINDDKGGLSAVYWAGDAADLKEKPNEIGFSNSYEPNPKPKPGPSGGGGGGGNSTRRPAGDALIGDDDVPLAVLGAFEEDPIPLAVLPMTGDVTNMALWMLMFTFCTLGMAVTLLLRRKVA